MRKSFVLKSTTRKQQPAPKGLLQRAIRRFRRGAPSIEATAACGRAERLFAVNFRSMWTR